MAENLKVMTKKNNNIHRGKRETVEKQKGDENL